MKASWIDQWSRRIQNRKMGSDQFCSSMIYILVFFFNASGLSLDRLFFSKMALGG